MTSQQSIITLSVREAGTDAQRTFVYHVTVDGEVVASNRSLTPAQSQVVREFSRRHSALFEQHRRWLPVCGNC